MSTLYEKVLKPNTKSIFYEEEMMSYKRYKAHNDTLVFHDGTDNETLFVPIEVMDKYKCILLSRADFDAIERDCSSLTNEQMEYIAQNIGEMLVENYYWEALEYWADDMNMPKDE